MNEHAQPTREELISLCERAIVPQEKWQNRDSESAQKGVGRVWQLLKCGCKYEICTKDNSPDYYSDAETWKIKFWVQSFMWFENGIEDDDEDGYDTDSNGQYLSFFIPTEKSLEAADGEDWY